jgi:hypothetical protein
MPTVPKVGDLVYIGGMPTVEEIKLGISETYYYRCFYYKYDQEGRDLFGGEHPLLKELCCVMQVYTEYLHWTNKISCYILLLMRRDGSTSYALHE